MFQKNSFFDFFTSCYRLEKQQIPSYSTASKLTSIPNKVQHKISLKKGRHQSFQDVNKQATIKQLKVNEKAQSKTRSHSFKENQFRPNNTIACQTSHQKKNDQSLTCKELISKTCEFPPTKKFLQTKFQMENEKKVNQFLLQKTTKNMQGDDKQNSILDNSTQKMDVQMRQVKELNKQKFICRLEDYKQSLVSITFENGKQPVLQQSQVEVNFFNPSTSKVVQLQRYLHSRQ